MKGLFSNGVKAVVLDLLPEFERKNGAKLDVTWPSTNMLLEEIGKGASGDLAILTDEAIDDLIRIRIRVRSVSRRQRIPNVLCVCKLSCQRGCSRQ